MGIGNDKSSENVRKPETRKFYDVHCHAFNWSHLNVLVFLKRFKIKRLLMAGPLVWLYSKIKPDTMRKFNNLLSLMENDLGNYFLLTEYFLKNKDPKVVSTDNTVTIGDVAFNKIVLTPLIMDWGYRNIEQPGIFYNIPPRKPIREQVTDVFNGIKFYCENKLELRDGKLKSDKDGGKDNKLFEIYPFLGINTKHYTDKKVERMLEDHFKDYVGNQESLYNNMGMFKGNIDDKKEFGSNFYAGIKVYPPLGFDPWPDDSDERKKVEILYDYCINKGIPITTHCSNGGFRVDENADDYTAPGTKWTKVLKKYSQLKINFGHFGYQSNRLLFFRRTQWRDSIIELMSEHPNVYADFSCIKLRPKDCKRLEDLLKERESTNPELKDRIFFGSDFLISLIWTDSYNKYLNDFKTTEHLQSLKENLCSKNPEKFLFN